MECHDWDRSSELQIHYFPEDCEGAGMNYESEIVRNFVQLFWNSKDTATTRYFRYFKLDFCVVEVRRR